MRMKNALQWRTPEGWNRHKALHNSPVMIRRRLATAVSIITHLQRTPTRPSLLIGQNHPQLRHPIP
ncbi:MAG: hypothetical protein ACM359_21545, partial [Bacillota bacterium]